MPNNTFSSPPLTPAGSDSSAPRLLIETESAYREFARNLRDTFFPHQIMRHPHGPDWPEFWADVFVPSGTPWWRFVESFSIHILVLASLWGVSRAWLLRPQAVPQLVFSKNDVIYFPASEYLPPLNTGRLTKSAEKKGEPAYARQAILSVPAEADNRTQTVVTPPDVKLKNEVAVPNVVAWKTVNPAMPITAVTRLQAPRQQSMEVVPPPPAVEHAADRRRLETLDTGVIAPPPDVAMINSRRNPSAPQAAIIEPPPTVHGQIRQLGDISVGHTEVVPPAPQLALVEQRAVHYASASAGNIGANVVPPPPSVARGNVSELRRQIGTRGSTEIVPPPPSLQGSVPSSNRIVALGLHSVAGAPPAASGNRRGTFAMSPKGKPGAPGTPDIQASTRGGMGSGPGAAGKHSDLPSGLLVQPERESSPSPGKGDGRSVDDKNVLAEAKPPLRVTAAPRRALASTFPPSAEEREVFGDRKFYSMTLNMPNLNSAGGSWVIRFAELKDHDQAGDLTAPEAVRKVDPAYPLELMRTQIQGKVTLYAVIHSDGSVGEVRVLNSVDERLDDYARSALTRWRFRPATKAGNAVALEAVVTIPFRSRRPF